MLAATAFATKLDGKQDQCRAIVLAGGGTLGAYEAGVIWGLVKNAENKTDFAYDIVSGVSVGSVNGAWMAVHDIGTEEHMAEVLSETWQNWHTLEIYGAWIPLSSMFDHSGLFNTTPLRDSLQRYFDAHGNEYKRHIIMGGLDANSGNYFTTTEKIPVED